MPEASKLRRFRVEQFIMPPRGHAYWSENDVKFRTGYGKDALRPGERDAILALGMEETFRLTREHPYLFSFTRCA